MGNLIDDLLGNNTPANQERRRKAANLARSAPPSGGSPRLPSSFEGGGAVNIAGPLNAGGTAVNVEVTNPGAATGYNEFDKAAFTPGVSRFVPIGGQVDDTATNTLTEGTEGAVRSTPDRGLHVSPRIGSLEMSQPLTDTQLRATAVPVSGPLTDTELRATAVPVSGPLTDTQLRATAVPVTGPLTDTQLRATAVPIGPVTPGTGAFNLGKQEDEAHTSGEVGIMALAVRNDTEATITSADGDYSPMTTDGQGRLKSVLYASDGTGNVPLRSSPGLGSNALDVQAYRVVPGTTATDLGKAEDAAHTSGDVGVMALTVRNDTEADLTNANTDYAPLSTDQAGRIITKRTAPAANILNGSATNVVGAVIITIPANRTWRGSISIQASFANGPGVVAAAIASMFAQWTPGTGGTPAYAPATVSISMPAALAAAVVGQHGEATITIPDVILYAGTTAGTITTVVGAGTVAPTHFSVMASGVIE